MSARVATTQWSQVLAARDGTDTEAREALESLCRTYWKPLYAYIRKTGTDPDDAADLTQGFFAELLAKDGLANVDPSKGRFRAFLLASARNFLSHERAKARAIKRGRDIAILSLDREDAERRYAAHPRDEMTPEDVFQHRWAVTVLDSAMTRLEQESSASSDEQRFRTLRPYLTSHEQNVTYRQAAKELGLSEGAVKVAVHRLRQRFGRYLRIEVAATVLDPAEVDSELRHLLELVRR